MPLIKSTSKAAFRQNILRELTAGKPQKQAVAIAYATKRAAAKKKVSAMRVNPDVYPPDGWFFVDLDGVRHSGHSLKNLIEAVTSFRMRLGRPVGDVSQEVIDFTCARYPISCKNGVRTAPKPPIPVSPIAAQVVQWLSKVYRGLLRIPDARVSAQEANRRAVICMKCPRQKSWLGGCGTCNASISQLGMQIRNGEDVRNGAQLRACSILAEDTRTSIWLDRLQPVPHADLPPECWRKAK